MKLFRFGTRGTERPGILDASGAVRDLGHIIQDIDGTTVSAEQLDVLRVIDPWELPV